MTVNFHASRAEDIFDDIGIERLRQDHLRDIGKFKNSMPDLVLAGRLTDALTVLAEEFGEVSRVVCESIDEEVATAHLREELIQLAACCVGWIEAIDLDRDDAPEETNHTHPDWSGVPRGDLASLPIIIGGDPSRPFGGVHFPEEEDYGLYAGAPQE